MKKRLTRLFAVCVCLIIVLSACASAPSGESTVSVTTEESKETSALELSEVNAESTSSETEPLDESSESESSTPEGHISADSEASIPGDITITPVEPTYPEERETTLEKVMSFDIGIDGLFQYDFLFHDDPSDAMMICPGQMYADGKGTFYHTLGSKLVCLNDGAWFPDVNWKHIEDIEIIGDALYLLRIDGSVEQYDLSAGLGNPTLKNEYQVYDSNADEWGTLQVLGEKEPVFVSDKNEIFTLSKEPINDKEAPFLFQSGIQSVTVENGVFVIPSDDKKNELSVISDTVLWTTAYYGGDDTECVMYDQNGNLACRVLIDVEYHGNDTPCNIEFEHAGARYTIETYLSCQVVIGKTVFEEMFQARVFYDSYGTMYLAAYYTDHCDIYRVDAGYTSADFEDHDIFAETNDISHTSSTTETTSSVQWIELTKEEVAENAGDMIGLGWIIKRGNLDDRDRSTVSLPHYLRGRQIGEEMKNELGGIPYCKGGYNGIGGTRDFKTVAGTVIDGDGCPTTGNVARVSGNESGTIGLDCARFVCKALDFHSSNATLERDGLSPEQFQVEYAHIGHWYDEWDAAIMSSYVLNEWDVLVNDEHAMFYWKTVGGQVYVYDTSSVAGSGRTMGRNFGQTLTQLDAREYKIVHLYSEYGHNATHHWTQCASCGGFDSESEPHTFGNYVSISASSHAKVCTACGYQTNVQSHTFTYTPDLVGRHAKSCATCGYTATELHTYSTEYSYTTTQHWQTCTRCGTESTRTSHTLSFNHSTTQHWQACGTCGYTARAFAHTYNTYGVCTVCGYRRTAKTTEEPDLPTDDFIVLCVEPKEEFWESVQR